MAKIAEFEEKTYEKYFGHELARRAEATYSPGQRGENHLGFDEAFLVPWLWRWRFPHSDERWWARRDGISLTEMDRLADEVGRHLPPFRFNLFVQYKRPEWIEGPRGGERSWWGQPYYRYAITPHQQQALIAVANAASGRASVVYAAPAFWQSDVLFKHAAKRRIVAKSNIALVSTMLDHLHFTYIGPGTHGAAHSDPVEVESPRIDAVFDVGFEQPEVPFRSHLAKMAFAIDKGLIELPQLLGRLAAARKAQLLLAGYDEDVPSESIVYAMATIEGFQDAFGATLYAFAGPRVEDE
jgi:hypothetical protein